MKLKKNKLFFLFKEYKKRIVAVALLCFFCLAIVFAKQSGRVKNNVLKLSHNSQPSGSDNKIYNAESLTPISFKLRANNKLLTLIKVLHIGDSHVKSGFFAEALVDRLNDYYAQTLKRNVFFNSQVFSKVGTKYSDYAHLSELDNLLIKDKPDLVIISLGTNDAFSGSANAKFYEKINNLVTKIKALSPASCLLLTTPADALKKNVQTGLYQTMPQIEYAVNTIIKYANNNKLAYWDLHQQMGGTNSINNWYLKKLAAPDRIHFTPQGYNLIASWLFEALKNCL